jgi:hypothetical protein
LTFFKRRFYNALRGQPRVHVKFLSFFLQATYMSRNCEVRERWFGQPSNIILKDVTRVNVPRKYIKYSGKFLLDQLEPMKYSLPLRSNIFVTLQQKHAAAPLAGF